MSDMENQSVTPTLPLSFRLSHLLGTAIGKRFDHVLDNIREGQLRLTWPDGTTTQHGQRSDNPDDNAYLELHNFRALRQFMLSGEVGFAESYLRGDWTTDSLRNLFFLVMRNEESVAHALTGSRIARLVSAGRHWLNRNSIKGSQRNIAFHYDLGNDFYQLWLDESMSYSSGIFGHDSTNLAQAQQAKLDRAVEMMSPSPGARILEIGCGWGAMANRLADQSACQVKGISLSAEQLDYAREHNHVEHDGSTEFVHEDYRVTTGKYDHIVSIEMFEAVGEQYWETYFSTLSDLLEEGGTAVLQVITILEDRFDTYRASPDFIQRYIFPGGMLPSKTHLRELVDAAGFDVVESDWFGLSYAETLERWRERFEHVSREVIGLGFDERFLRMWRYYLTYCESGFRFGSTDVGMLLLRKR